MILSPSKEGTQFRPSSSANEVAVKPPLVDRFVGAIPLAINRDEQIRISGMAEQSLEETVRSAEAISQKMLLSARKDALEHPHNADVLTNLALALANAGQLKDAIATLREVLKIDRLHYPALSALASLLASNRDTVQAYEVLRQAAKEYPHDERFALGMANLEIQKGNFGVAETILLPYANNASGILFRYTLAIVYLATGRPNEAIQWLREGTRSDIRLPQAHHVLGVAYAMRGDLNRAIRAFRTALSLAPNLRESVHGLAVTHMRLGQFDKAADVLRGYVHKTNDPESLELLGDSYRQLKLFEKSRRIYESLLYDLKNSPPAIQGRLLNSIGICYALERNFAKAEAIFAGSIALAGKADSNPHNNLARIYLSTNRFREMLDKAAETMTLFPGDSDAEVLHATALKKLKRYSDSLSEFRGIIQKCSSGAAAAYAEIGWILSDSQRDLPSALEILKEGYAKFPKNPIIANNYAYVLLSLGRPREARPVLESVSNSQNAPVLSATWGLLRLWEGDFNDGMRLYRQASEHYRAVGETEFANAAIQKMNLELARAYIRHSKLEDARYCVLRGLELQHGNELFKEDLQKLKEQLTESGS